MNQSSDQKLPARILGSTQNPAINTLDGLRLHTESWTSARVLVGRSGSAYRTATWLQLRQDHAAARDAVRDEVPFEALHSFAIEGLEQHQQQPWLYLQSKASDKATYLRRPDWGRQLDPSSQDVLQVRGVREPDLQMIVGDGLSASAVMAQVPPLYPRLVRGASERGWSLGQTIYVKYCRVGILNAIGATLRPKLALLLIGERPGLATAESLSAYFAYRPEPGHTDAQRNLISNIHARGVQPADAAERILRFCDLLLRLGLSGVTVKEDTTMFERS